VWVQISTFLLTGTSLIQQLVAIAQAVIRCTHLPPHLNYVNALLCETQMLQIVTLRSDYLYQTAHLCIINSTEDAT